MNLTNICGHLIDTALIVGISPIRRQVLDNKVSMQFSFTVYLKSYEVVIKSNWIDSFDKQEEKQKEWDEIRRAHADLSDYLKERSSSLQTVSFNQDFVIVVSVHDRKDQKLIASALKNNGVEFNVTVTGTTKNGSDEYTFEIKCRGVAEAATAYLCIMNEMSLIVKTATL